jgi:hypothetical protein
MKKFASESYHARLSDFNFLLFLSGLVEGSVMREICACVRAKKSMPRAAHEALDTLIVTQGWI